jgi:hypothetical protein
MYHVKTLEDDDVDTAEDDKDRLQVVWGSRHQNPSDYHRARDGDHLMTPFECDLCVFRKLKGVSPINTSHQDQILLAAIRRILLDAFWSRSSSTVSGNRNRIKRAQEVSTVLGLTGPFCHQGTIPSWDHCGYEIALQMIETSRRSGKYSKNHLQWDTVRKLRSSYALFSRISPQASTTVLALVDDQGQVQGFTQDPTSSFWFSRFLLGCRRRMGQDWGPNRALTTELVIEVLKVANQRLGESESPEDTNRWLVFLAYSVITYTLSLRGSEGFLLDLKGLHRNFNVPGRNFLQVALLGKVKGESHDRCHLLPSVLQTSSGIEVHHHLQQLIDYKQSRGNIDGPAILDLDGKVMCTRVIDDMLHECLEDILDTLPDMFPPGIHTKEDIHEKYMAFRSYRRGSVTRATNQRVKSTDIDTVNRWHVWNQSGGNRPSLPMRQHYVQYDQLLDPFLRYTLAM